MKDITSTLIVVVIIAAFLALSAACGYARYQECRTTHPWWYCIQSR
jgi:predicted membrane chloride channel (bestrophin family)